MEGYKGFYKTENDLIVRDAFSHLRTVGEMYYLDDDMAIKYGGDSDFYIGGHGFHFADSISKTMPHFRTAIPNHNYAVAQIKTSGEVVASEEEKGCYAARGYQINKILSHSDIIDVIEDNINYLESVRILGQYSRVMDDQEKQRIKKAYYETFKIYLEDFDENWRNIYCLYEGVMYLNSNLDYEYFSTNDKKEYTRKVIKKII